VGRKEVFEGSKEGTGEKAWEHTEDVFSKVVGENGKYEG
jgi:hypothetical protein